MRTKHTPTPWPHGLFVLLNPESDKADAYYGTYALQSDGNTVCDGSTLEHAEYISRAVNSHAILIEAMERAADMLPANAACGVLRAALKLAKES